MNGDEKDVLFSEPPTARDWLALQRTQLALTRTVLGFVRTAIGLIALGVASLHYEHDWWALAIAAACFVLAMVFLVASYLIQRHHRQASYWSCNTRGAPPPRFAKYLQSIGKNMP